MPTDHPLHRARAIVAFQPASQDRPTIPDEDGWAALHTLVATAFGDVRAFRAHIPARDDDTDFVVDRWVGQLERLANIARAVVAHIASPGAEDEAIRHATVRDVLDYIDDLEADRDAMRAQRDAAIQLAAEGHSRSRADGAAEERARILAFVRGMAHAGEWAQYIADCIEERCPTPTQEAPHDND